MYKELGIVRKALFCIIGVGGGGGAGGHCAPQKHLETKNSGKMREEFGQNSGKNSGKKWRKKLTKIKKRQKKSSLNLKKGLSTSPLGFQEYITW